MQDKDQHLLCKPIKFFHEMEEFFLGCNVDGSLAMDQQTCLDDGSKSDGSDSEGMNDMSYYAQLVDLAGNDFDTLQSPTGYKMTSSRATIANNSSSSTPQAGMKRPRGVKSLGKKQPKPKSHFIEVTKGISTTMKAMVHALGNPPPAPLVSGGAGPQASGAIAQGPDSNSHVTWLNWSGSNATAGLARGPASG